MFRHLIIFILFFSFIEAKIGANDFSKSFIESFLQDSNAIASNINDSKDFDTRKYVCKGDDNKSTCTIKSLTLDTLILKDVKVTTTLDSKNANFAFSANVDKFSNDDEENKDFIPKKIDCKLDSTLDSNIISNKSICDVTADTYTIKGDFTSEWKSSSFSNKEIGEILGNMDENKSKYKILLKDVSLNLDAPKLGDKLFAYSKRDNPEIKKEEFISKVNIVLTSFPMIAAQDGDISPETLLDFSNLAIAIGAVLTSKKKGVIVTFTRKNSTFEDLESFTKKLELLSTIMELQKDYDMKVITR